MLSLILAILIDVADVFDEAVPGLGTLIMTVVNVAYNYKVAGKKWALIALLESPFPLLDTIPSATLARILRHSKLVGTLILIAMIVLVIFVIIGGYATYTFLT